MPVYDQPVRLLLREMIEELASRGAPEFSRQYAIQWFAKKYPKVKEGTISAHLIRFSTNAPSRLHYNVQPDEDLLFQIDGSRFRPYRSEQDPAPIHSKSDVAGDPKSVASPVDEEHGSEFAYEHDLRDYLAKNLSKLEPGLQLFQDEGINGIEFPAGGRYIDILAIDPQQQLVVVELKVSRGYDRVVGQILRYMAWVKQHHAEPGQTVRGIIAAREISEDLKLACSCVEGVALYEYKMSVQLRKVEPHR